MKGTPLAEWLMAQGLTPRGVPAEDDAHGTRQERPRAAGPVNRRLFDLIRRAILSGHLQAGQKLPPTRELAAELRLGRNTVLYAYERLEGEGYTVSRVGSGTYVSDTMPDPAVVRRISRPDIPPEQAGRCPQAALSQRARTLLARAGASEHQVGAFVPGIPDISHFPYATWHRLMAKSWRRASPDLMGYGSSRGYPPLKRALAEYLRLARGVQCEAEQVMITQGAHQALDLCARLLADPGDHAWIEDPCYWGARSVFTAAGLQLHPMRVDRQGLCPPAPEADRVPPPPKIVFVTPSHQYPSGVVMSLARRRLLLEIVNRSSAWIVEDDYDSEFRYEGVPLPSLQGLDVHRRTLYVGSFSKSLYPGLRLGFLVLPAELVDPFARMQSELYRGGLLMLQATLAEFIADGHYAAHVRRMRKIYGRRQALLSSELRRQLGERARIVGSEAGLHLTVELTDTNDIAVSDAALARGIVARPLSSYYDDAHGAMHGLVLGYGGVADEHVALAVSGLAHAIDHTQPLRRA